MEIEDVADPAAEFAITPGNDRRPCVSGLATELEI
jgi:hypothetical protein